MCLSPSSFSCTSLDIFLSGGSVLAQLLKSDHKSIKDSQISVLIRGEEKAKALNDVGVTAIPFSNLDESDLLEKVASEHDGMLLQCH